MPQGVWPDGAADDRLGGIETASADITIELRSPGRELRRESDWEVALLLT